MSSQTIFPKLAKAARDPVRALRAIREYKLYWPRRLYVDWHPFVHRLLHPREKKKVFKLLLPQFQNKKGVRIGGSLEWYFEDMVASAQVIDVDIQSCHHGIHTEADIIAEATDLYFSADSEYDFVCSGHVLEHVANPLKAIYEWKRVVREGGIIYCGVPDKRYTFDRKRERTPISHLISDYQSDVSQEDATHLYESLQWDEKMAGKVTYEDFRGYILDNPKTAVHHHAWTMKDIGEIVEYCGLELIFLTRIGHTIHAVGKRLRIPPQTDST